MDPAVVNLSAFETFFEEKRPFFLEGAQTFGNFGRDGATDNWGFNTSDPNIFYSRRIGRSPQLSPSGDFIDAPLATTILGAAKITGKTSGGWTLAALDAVTGRETARVRTGLASDRTTVEPLTNYFAARLQRTLGGRAGIGLISTMVSRQLDSPTLTDALADRAYVAGGDGYFFLSQAHNWVINGKLAASRISGTETVIDSLQRAAAALLPAARRAGSIVRSASDVALRLQRSGQPQSQQRHVALQCVALGRESGIRSQRPWVHGHRRSRRRSCRVDLAKSAA